MSYRSKKAIKKAAKAGASGVVQLFLSILKVIGIVLLIAITTGAIFACIFVIYIKTNLITTDLDVTLEEYSLSETSIIYCKNNDTGKYEPLVTLQSSEGDRYWVDYENIPLDIEHALISIEDQRFYTHHGVDWYRTAGAFVNMFLGMKNTFGGSTITQQLIKNVTGEDEGTVQRKLTEIFRALEFEKQYDKDEIITWYLNVVYFGHRQYGIGAAASYYFGKDPDELSLAEICSIIGITNNPSLYSPMVHPENNKKRQETILYKMFEQGYISREEYEKAKAEKLNFSFKKNDGINGEIYTWFEEAVIDDVTAYFAESRGISTKQAQRLLLTGGYRIYSTLDPDIQECVDTIYQDLDQIPETTGSSQQLQSAIVIIDPFTGNIVGLAGSVGEKTGNLQFSLATDARRAPGSSIKPIAVYGPAVDLGLITPDTKFEDEPDIELRGTNWFPKNDDRQNRGIVTIRQGIVSSLNTISAQVLDLVTPAVSYNFLTNTLGIKLNPSDQAYAPLALGQLTDGATVREMATAYCIFVNDGIYTESRTFTEIYDKDWNLVYENVPETHSAISPTTAYWITSMLKDAVAGGTGTSANLKFMPTAGKTGTSGSSVDRWFCGYTPYYVAACWAGYKTPAKIKTSGNPAAKLWKKVMTLVHEDLEPKSFSKPANTYLRPVPGVEPLAYFVRGITVDPSGGVSVLYEEKVGERGVGREVEVEAKKIDGYDLVGNSKTKLTISEAEENVVEFIYVSKVVEPDPPDIPDTPDTPDTPDPPDPPVTPDPEPEDPPAPTPVEPAA